MILMVDRTMRGPNRICDARCYQAAPGGRCGCICDGKNHAVGIHVALENIRTLFLDTKPEVVTRAAQRALTRTKNQRNPI